MGRGLGTSRKSSPAHDTPPIKITGRYHTIGGHELGIKQNFDQGKPEEVRRRFKENKPHTPTKTSPITSYYHNQHLKHYYFYFPHYSFYLHYNTIMNFTTRPPILGTGGQRPRRYLKLLELVPENSIRLMCIVWTLDSNIRSHTGSYMLGDGELHVTSFTIRCPNFAYLRERYHEGNYFRMYGHTGHRRPMSRPVYM